MITVVASLKGGSGKSTVSFNLAVWLKLAGADVKIHDLDPQGTLTDVAEVRTEEGYEPGLTIDQQLPNPNSSNDNPKQTEDLIDVGLADYRAVEQALRIADRILVPVTPSQADIWSTQRFIDMVQAQHPEQTAPPIHGFINRGDTHHAVRESDEAAAALIALPGIDFIRKRLHQRTLYRRSFSEGLAVFEMEPRSKAALEFTRLAAALYPGHTH